MKTIKQPVGSRLCHPCAIAMVTDRSLALICQMFTPNRFGSMEPTCSVRVLAELGYLSGFHGDFEESINLSVSDLNGEIHNRILASVPAIVTVESDVYEHALHSVVWDLGVQFVRDPNPDHGSVTDLCYYQVRGWSPVVKSEPFVCDPCRDGRPEDCQKSPCDKAPREEADDAVIRVFNEICGSISD